MRVSQQPLKGIGTRELIATFKDVSVCQHRHTCRAREVQAATGAVDTGTKATVELFALR